MITGLQKKPIESYVMMHDGRRQAWIPAKGQRFMGIPFGYYHDGQPPFIEVLDNDGVMRTVNCQHVAEITFAAPDGTLASDD